MIIKKKYTTIKKLSEIEQAREEQPIEEIKPEISVQKNEKKDIPPKKEIEKQEKTSKTEKQTEDEEIKNEEEASVEVQEQPKKEKKKKKTIEDLDLTIENIKFDQREERREGTRRRGYRRTQDRNIVTRAQQEAESIKEVAKKEGYEAGIANATKDLNELKSKFADFFHYKDEIFNKVSDCIYDISVEMAKKIINKTVETDKEYIIPMIKGVVEEINKTENKITLKVMPKDVEIVRDNVSNIFSDNFFEAAISVIPDNSLKDGGVIVETSNGIIDASISTQLAIIEKTFAKKEES